MSVDFALPQMGFDMTEAKIARWAKAEGDTVAPGEVLAEVATEKVNLELVDHPGGVIEKILVPEGETVAVGTPIIRFADGKTASGPAQESAQESPQESPQESGQESAPGASDTHVESGARVPPAEINPAEPPEPPDQEAETATAESPRPQAPRSESADAGAKPPTPDTSAAKPSASDTSAPQETTEPAEGQAPEEPGPTPASNGDAARLRVSPLARKLADQKGVDLTRVQGSGPQGRILRDDVLKQAQAGTTVGKQTAGAAPSPAAPTPVTAAAAPAPPGPRELSPMRQAIARRMQESKQQIPHFYVQTEVRMDAVYSLRGEFQKTAGEDVNITINDFVIKAAALALARRPELNAWFVDGKIRAHDRINIGLAVALEEGLVVPALLDCQNRSLGQISAAARELAQRARKGALKPEEFTGGTFSISNLGMLGVDLFQAIINPPQVGILAVGAAQKTPVVEGDTVAIGTIMKLCLSCDHRVVDGAIAARFLADLKRMLETPMLMLL